MPLGDRTNKVANCVSIPTAVYQQQPKGSTFGKRHGCQASLPSGHAVPTGMRTDENRDEGIACIRHDAHERDSQLYDVSTCADADAQVHAESMSSSCTSVDHATEVDTGPDTMMQCLSLSDNVEASQNSTQEARLGHSFDKLRGSGAVQEQAVFTVASGSTVSAIEAVTVSPGRRVFAAHVTVTRPTTPASPA